MEIIIDIINKKTAEEITKWEYDPPYDIYNHSPENITHQIEYMIDKEQRFYIFKDPQEILLGFFSIGKDGQVQDGDYSEDAIDIGIGIRPDLTGNGNGSVFVQKTIEAIQEQYPGKKLRVTVADFNSRAKAVWEKNGFLLRKRFTREYDQKVFVILERTFGEQ
jgi:[ribosomal protein S18]-alanine N-acetyltransferase